MVIVPPVLPLEGEMVNQELGLVTDQETLGARLKVTVALPAEFATWTTFWLSVSAEPDCVTLTDRPATVIAADRCSVDALAEKL